MLACKIHLRSYLRQMRFRTLSEADFHTRRRLAHYTGRTLLRLVASQPPTQNFLGPNLNRTEVLRMVVHYLGVRFSNICRRLNLNVENPQQGVDVANTVKEIDDFQRNNLLDFAATYNQRGLLTGLLQDDLLQIVIIVLTFVTRCNHNLYEGTTSQRLFITSDMYEGNLYQRWRDLGNRQFLFMTLAVLRNRVHATNARRNNDALVRVEAALRHNNDVVWRDYSNILGAGL